MKIYFCDHIAIEINIFNVKEGGTVYMTGKGASYRLGLGDDRSRWIPTACPFTEENPIMQVSCGSSFTFFLTSN